jgi:hypothetical protein
MDLQRTLQNTNRLTASDLPLTLREMRRGLPQADANSDALERIWSWHLQARANLA